MGGGKGGGGQKEGNNLSGKSRMDYRDAEVQVKEIIIYVVK